MSPVAAMASLVGIMEAARENNIRIVWQIKDPSEMKEEEPVPPEHPKMSQPPIPRTRTPAAKLDPCDD
jgi:hypothetical protein